jgi:hypothetical protein
MTARTVYAVFTVFYRCILSVLMGQLRVADGGRAEARPYGTAPFMPFTPFYIGVFIGVVRLPFCPLNPFFTGF